MWKYASDELPVEGVPVLLCINGIVQNVTYEYAMDYRKCTGMPESDDRGTPSWGTYHFDDDMFPVEPDHLWMPLPAPPKSDTMEAVEQPLTKVKSEALLEIAACIGKLLCGCPGAYKYVMVSKRMLKQWRQLLLT